METNSEKSSKLIVWFVVIFMIFLAVIILFKPGLPPYSKTYHDSEDAINKECTCLGTINESVVSNDNEAEKNLCMGMPYNCEYKTISGENKNIFEYYLATFD